MGSGAPAQVCAALARQLGCQAEQVLPFSTGVIMEPLPVERIVAALPPRSTDCDWASAAEAIMTTDTVPKAFSQESETGRKAKPASPASPRARA